jgi:hypothetical protein
MKNCSTCKSRRDPDDLNLWGRCERCQGEYDMLCKIADWIRVDQISFSQFEEKLQEELRRF